ncbi:MAG: AtpZ/AtpI family protein [Candidatus Binataceae bacterium]
MMPVDGERPKLWRFLGIGAEFFSPILGGAVAGYYLDEHFRTQPWMVVSGVLLGVFLGFYRLFVELRDFQKSLESVRR